jgi:antitoxin FitA
MAQILVRNIDNEVKERLRQRAVQNGRSLEAEVRALLRDSVRNSSLEDDAPEMGLGDRLVELLSGDWDDFKLPERLNRSHQATSPE